MKLYLTLNRQLWLVQVHGFKQNQLPLITLKILPESTGIILFY